MDIETLRCLRDFVVAYSAGKCAPYDWPFREQEACEKLQMAIQREIDAKKAVTDADL